jgi:hypothetical protein
VGAVRQLNMGRKFLFGNMRLAKRDCIPLALWERVRREGNGRGESLFHNLGQRFAMTVILAALGLTPGSSLAAPTTFEPVIGSALQCNDHIDPVYFKDYLIRFYKNPYKTEGEAYWFKPDPAQRLYGLELLDIYVSTESSRYAFLGVIFKEKLDTAKKKMQEVRGISYLPFSGDTVLRSAQGSFLIEYDNTKTKLFCVKYRVTQ